METSRTVRAGGTCYICPLERHRSWRACTWLMAMCLFHEGSKHPLIMMRKEGPSVLGRPQHRVAGLGKGPQVFSPFRSNKQSAQKIRWSYCT